MSVHRNFTHFKDTNISFSQNRNYQTWSSINLEGFTNHCLETLVFHSEEKKKKKKQFYSALRTKPEEISISPYYIFSRSMCDQLQKLLGSNDVYPGASSEKWRVCIVCKGRSGRKKRMTLVLEAQEKVGSKRTGFYPSFCQSCSVIQLIWLK